MPLLLVGLVAAAVPTRLASSAELLMFEGRGCPWCARWHAEIGPGYHKTEEGRRAPLRRLDIRQQESAGAVLARPVTVTPTFVLIDGGREVGRLVGYPGGEFFYGLLDELLSRLPQPAGADTSAPGRGTASACVGDAWM